MRKRKPATKKALKAAPEKNLPVVDITDNLKADIAAAERLSPEEIEARASADHEARAIAAEEEREATRQEEVERERSAVANSIQHPMTGVRQLARPGQVAIRGSWLIGSHDIKSAEKREGGFMLFMHNGQSVEVTDAEHAVLIGAGCLDHVAL